MQSCITNISTPTALSMVLMAISKATFINAVDAYKKIVTFAIKGREWVMDFRCCCSGCHLTCSLLELYLTVSLPSHMDEILQCGSECVYFVKTAKPLPIFSFVPCSYVDSLMKLIIELKIRKLTNSNPQQFLFNLFPSYMKELWLNTPRTLFFAHHFSLPLHINKFIKINTLINVFIELEQCLTIIST